jgi:DNA repair protein RecN (Recombination protein N)
VDLAALEQRLLTTPMLLALSVRDIVLIDRLEFELDAGLCALTGETGAGKSILLDALGLALGARGEAGLLREGAERGSVVAHFALPAGHPARALLEQQGLPVTDELVLRRTLGSDGRSRAFVNDQAVSVGLLRQLGETLAEVHGQHDERGLMNAAGHRALLDAFGVAPDTRRRCAEAHAARRAAADALAAAEAALRDGLAEIDYLRHVLAELEAMAPKPGEAAELSDLRQFLRQGEKLREALAEASAVLAENGGLDDRLRAAERALARVAGNAGGRFDAALEALVRAATEATEAAAQVQQAAVELDLDPGRLERVEERWFALRELARKHRVDVDALPELQAEKTQRLARLEAGEAGLEELRAALMEAERAYEQAAAELTAERRAAAARLDRTVAKELGPLKLERASFRTRLEPLPTAQAGPEGAERVYFEVATNPGSEPGPLNRIASGGELARFTLALKVALAGTRSAGTLIFDEVDSGVGGAVADRVGVRLARLAETAQVLVVTHSPQVAARARHHWNVVKHDSDSGALTRIVRLDEAARREEIARMLAGAQVTAEARAAADSLLEAAS